MLTITNLSADYGGKPALENINLSLESGELPLTLDADSGQMVKEVSVTPTAPGEARIAYWIEDQQGKVVGKNARVEAVTAAP